MTICWRRGMKPFVELSFMPQHLAKEDVRGMFFYRPNICMPKDDQAWIDYIQSFVRFLIDRYGQEEVESWYFEVWNEPDLPVVFFHGTREDYFHLYEITARAIKEVDEKIRVGGPSTSGSKWVKSFVAFCKEHNVPVDFVTTHQYAGDPLGGVLRSGRAGERGRDGRGRGHEGADEQRLPGGGAADVRESSEGGDSPGNPELYGRSPGERRCAGTTCSAPTRRS